VTTALVDPDLVQAREEQWQAAPQSVGHHAMSKKSVVALG
jgi:hypothetical protein